jgi:hypothetical protein
MTQIVYAGEPGIAGNNPFSTKKCAGCFLILNADWR